MDNLNELRWVKSSYSGSGGGAGGQNCVEVAVAGAGRAVRDSTNPSGPAFVFSNASWAGFVAAVKRGEFDPTP